MEQTSDSHGLETFPDSGKNLRQDKMTRLWQVLILLAMLAVTTVLNVFLEKIIHPSSLVFIYLVPTIAGAIYFGTWAAVFSFVGGFLVFDFFFVHPYYSLHISDPQDVYNITVYFLAAVLMTYLISIVRRQNAFLKGRLDRVSPIEDMSRDFLLLTPVEQLSPGQSLPESLRARVLSQLGQLVLRYIRLAVDVPAFFFFREEDGSVKVWAQSSLNLDISETDKAAAAWTLNHGDASGAGTLTHSDSRFFVIPMNSHGDIIGGFGIQQDARHLFPEQRRLLGTISNLATIVAARWVDFR
jgi:two-component system sensor histidine kinase KdpD